MEALGVPAGPVHTVDQVLRLAQVEARDGILEIEHPLVPDLKVPGFPVKLSGTPGEVRRPPPLLGQHTEEVLEELGYDEARIRRLRRDGVV